MTQRAPGTLRVLRILAGNSALRLLRMAHVQRAKRQQAASSQPARKRARSATGRKSGSGLMALMLLLLPLFGFQAFVMSCEAAEHLWAAANRAAPGGETILMPTEVERYKLFSLANSTSSEDDLRALLDEEGVDESSRPPRAKIVQMFREHGAEALHDARRLARRDGLVFYTEAAKGIFAKTAGLLLALLVLMSFCTAFGGANASLGGGDWIQWWLLTFPVPTRSLTMARALEYSLVQLFPWFTLFPLSWQALAVLGQPWALTIAAGATLVTTCLTGALRLWAETQLRLRCTLHTMKNVQGVCTILSLLIIGVVFWAALSRETPHGFVDLAASLPAATLLLPGSWPIGIGMYGLGAVAAGVGVSAAVFRFGVMSSARALQSGAMRAGGVDAGARGHQRAWARGAGLGIGGKEVALLRRDRTFLVQTILVPVFIIGIQLIVNPKLGDADGAVVAIIAYVVGFYGALGGCFQVLSSEGRALWMLYSLPVSTLEILRRKTRLWAILCCCLGATALVVFSVRAEAAPLTFLGDLGFVLVGVWCSAHIAAAISVLGANTTPDSVQRQPKQRYVWLFMFLAGSYCAVLGLPDLGHRVAGATVYLTIAYALWLRGVERMRWLLDPVTDPRDELTLLDAAGALMTFFLLQMVGAGLFTVLFLVDRPILAQSLAFVGAGVGALLFVVARFDSRRVSIGEAFGWAGEGASRLACCASGAVGGALVGGLGLLYAQFVQEAAPDLIPPTPTDGYVLLLGVAVVAAPLVEELLFRGLLLGALRRAVSDGAAVVWSSLLFTFVHPMISWPPVFLLGLACALLRLRGAPVVACMVLHAVYNGVVVGCG